MPLGEFLSSTWNHIQGNLFPWLTEELGPLSETHKRLISTLELVRIEAFLRHWPGLPGRPPLDRAALARAFVAKMVMKVPTTSMLIEYLGADKRSRRLCGWERPGQVPSEATFSRAFAEFATSELPTRVHEALIKRTHEDRLVGHISRDATAIEAREKPVQIAAPEMPKRKRGRPRKGEVVEKEARRLERQAAMSLAEMLDDLPKHCAVGTKRNAKGHTTSWIGYKLHLDVADGDIPVSGLLSSASLHDSQAAIPHNAHGRPPDQPLRSHGQCVRCAGDQATQPQSRSCTNHRQESKGSRGSEGRDGGRNAGPTPRGLQACRGRALQRTQRSRACQWPAQR
jgi:hypothetical protein